MSGRARRRAAPAAGAAERFQPPPAGSIVAGTPDHCRLAITLTCRRPELRGLCAGVRFAVDPELDAPFHVEAGRHIVLHPASLAEPAAAAVLLRHALELALWQRLGGAGAHHACHVAARYLAGLAATERARARAALPPKLLAAYDAPAAPPLPQLAAPAEPLLAQGGGSRLHLDPESARNPYGCAARPQPEVLAFASSTASAISAAALREVEALRRTLLRAGLAGELPAALAALTRALKAELLATLGVADLGAEAILVPSGTDGEYAALQIARRRTAERLVNIVIAPEETGSGVLDAARGRHFATETPRGETVTQGAPLAGIAAEGISAPSVAIRAADGTPRPLAAIDAEVAALADQAVADGARCLVHLLDVSKTGLSAPGPAVLETLCARHGERLAVVVDACQLRQQERLREHLARGWMVLLTGSKFAMGPAFAGALLLPWQLAATAGRDPLPAGFGQYFGRAEWPDGWRDLTAALPATPNLGLLLRWRAALWEIQALRAVPDRLRARIVAELGAAIAATLAATPQLVPLPAAGEPPTIFPFAVLRAGAPLALAELRSIWRLLREDLSGRLANAASPGERRLAAMACQVGQPVTIGTKAALRLCIGAHLVTAVAFDPALGPTIEQRLARQIGRARLVLEKAALIARLC